MAELQLSMLRLCLPSQRFKHKIIKHRISITTLAHTLKIGSLNSRYSSYINAVLVETRGGYVKSFNRRKSASNTTAHQHSHRGNCATCSPPPIPGFPCGCTKRTESLDRGSTPLKELLSTQSPNKYSLEEKGGYWIESMRQAGVLLK